MAEARRRLSLTSELVLLIIIVSIAALLRLWQLADIPPALYRDEARNALNGLALIQGDRYPIYFKSNGGQEPIYMYLQAASHYLFKPGALAARIPSAVIGLLTIPALYLLARELFADGESRRVGWLAALGLATSFWHMNYSRIGFRGILAPLFTVGLFYFFWRGWRGDGLIYHLWAGVILGASLYTYSSAWFLPLILVAFVLIEALLSRLFPSSSGTREADPIQRWKGLAITAVSALVIFAPLGYYFLNHPYVGGRVRYLSIFNEKWNLGDPWGALLGNIVRTVLMFWREGGGNANLDPFSRIAFLLGLALSLTRLRKPPYVLTLLWLTVMLSPTALSAWAPHSLRAIGSLPATYLLVGLGVDSLWSWLTKYGGRILRRYSIAALWIILLGIAALGTILLASGLYNYNAYFIRWARERSTFYSFQGDREAFVDYIEALDDDLDIYLPLRLCSTYIQVPYLLTRDFPLTTSISILSAEEIALLSKGGAVCLLPEEYKSERTFLLLSRRLPGREGTVFLLPPLNDEKELADQVIEGRIKEEPVEDRYGRAVATAYFFDNAHSPFSYGLDISHPLEVNFANELQLVGYNLDETRAEPGSQFHVTLYWQTLSGAQDDYRIFVHLLDNWQQGWGEEDRLLSIANVYPTFLWEKGEILPDYYTVKISSSAPIGQYGLAVGLYEELSGERLNVLGKDLSPIDDKFVLGPVKVMGEPIALERVQYPLEVNLGGKLTFLGYSLGGKEIRAGQKMALTLYWRAEKEMRVDYTVFSHLVDPQGRIWAQKDNQPRGGRYPSSMWDVGEVVEDGYEIEIEENVPPGKYFIEIGMYELGTGARLPTFDRTGERLAEDKIVLREVEIAPCCQGPE